MHDLCRYQINPSTAITSTTKRDTLLVVIGDYSVWSDYDILEGCHRHIHSFSHLLRRIHRERNSSGSSLYWRWQTTMITQQENTSSSLSLCTSLTVHNTNTVVCSSFVSEPRQELYCMIATTSVSLSCISNNLSKRVINRSPSASGLRPSASGDRSLTRLGMFSP